MILVSQQSITMGTRIERCWSCDAITHIYNNMKMHAKFELFLINLKIICFRLHRGVEYECNVRTKSAWSSMGRSGQTLLGHYIDCFRCCTDHCTDANHWVSFGIHWNCWRQHCNVTNAANFLKKKNQIRLCVCCCRCAGACGGRSQPFDKKHDTCRRIFLGFLLIVVATGLM